MRAPYWLLGLPFDAVTLEQAKSEITAASEGEGQLVFATPNVSFLAQAERDGRFREDVLRTGLSLADGMPVIWLGRLLGVPFPGRVAGSDLLESLITDAGPRPLRVFFFGGDEGAAEAAMQAVNRRNGGLVAVGVHYPGFVSVGQMSSDTVIDSINRSEPDLLVVALGAAKGHRWIEANRSRLEVRVISHLGAAINFVAGRLRRAPGLMQRTGLEWLWRIKEEPALFRRYARDAWFLFKVSVSFVVPQTLDHLTRGRSPASMTVEATGPDTLSVTVGGFFRTAEVEALHRTLTQHGTGPDAVVCLRLARVTRVDALSVGWLYANRYRRTGGPTLELVCDTVSTATLKRWRAGFLAGPQGGNTTGSVCADQSHGH